MNTEEQGNGSRLIEASVLAFASRCEDSLRRELGDAVALPAVRAAIQGKIESFRTAAEASPMQRIISVLDSVPQDHAWRATALKNIIHVQDIATSTAREARARSLRRVGLTGTLTQQAMREAAKDMSVLEIMGILVSIFRVTLS